MKKAKSPSHLAVQSLPYRVRLRMYEKEKNDLFFMLNLPAGEIAKRQAELVRKYAI